MATEINTKYDPIAVEDKWYQFWMENRFFHSEPDSRPAYSIVIPPPNVTGVLHMGHMLNNTLQDVMIRRARMKGFNAVWVPGTDTPPSPRKPKWWLTSRSKALTKRILRGRNF
jgi:valyl-tRNA synthetase